MKKPVKITLFVVAALVAVLLVGVFIVFARLDSIVASTVESQGTQQLQVSTTLDDANVSVFGGAVTLNNLAIDNPEGYSAEHLFELGQVNVGVSYGDLLSDPIRVESINVNSPRLVIERGSVGGLAEQLRLNLRDLMENINLDTEGETVKLIIDQINVTGTQVVVRPNIEGLDPEYSLTIPDITMNNVGTAEGSENGAEIGRVLTEMLMVMAKRAFESEDLPPEVRAVLNQDFDAVLDTYKEKAKSELSNELRDRLGDRLGGEAGDALDSALEGDTDAAKDAAGDAVRNEARRRLEGLLGGGGSNQEGNPEGGDGGQ